VDDGAIVTPELVRWPLLRAKVAAQFVAAVTAAGQRLADIPNPNLTPGWPNYPATVLRCAASCTGPPATTTWPRTLEIPAASSRELRNAMDDDERPALAQRLLRERTEDPAARLAALLVLLFGQRVTRLAVLNLETVAVDDDGRVTLALAETPIRAGLTTSSGTTRRAARMASYAERVLPAAAGPTSSATHR
jgi:hypothetical protein